MALDSVASFLRLKDVINTCKHMHHSPTIGGISLVAMAESWKKLKTSNVLFVIYCVLESK